VLTCEQVIEATKGQLIQGELTTVFRQISIDSRKVKKSSIFIPIIGEQNDGHDFINDAIEQGAVGVLISKDVEVKETVPVIKVPDTVSALCDIGKFCRQRYMDTPFIGITGSMGKTSTKEIIATILKEKYNLLKTEGNLNTEIGVSTTLFELNKQHQVGIIEMGMRGFKQVGLLSKIVSPKIAIITNVGVSHIEMLGSRQNILKAKLEILDGLEKNGTIILNADDELLNRLEKNRKFKVVTYGTKGKVDYKAEDIVPSGAEGIFFTLYVGNKEKYKVHVPAPGAYNVYTALAGIAVGVEMGMNIEEIIEGISKYVPYDMRMNILSFNGIKIINDCYNANPDSMKAAVDILEEIDRGTRKIAVLGNMYELGDIAKECHQEIGRILAAKKIDFIVSVGNLAKNIAMEALNNGVSSENIRSFDDNKQVIEFLKSYLTPNEVVLVKGSRSMKMEQIVEGLRKE